MLRLFKKKFVRLPVVLLLVLTMALTVTTGWLGSMDTEAASIDEEVAKFPASYQPYIRKLKEAHPNWTFEPYKTGLDWEKMLRAETQLYYNLVPNWTSIMTLKGVDFSSNGGEKWYKTPTAWLSTDIENSNTKAYDWEKNDWNVLNGAYWVQASKDAIAYIMDPRNWITENNVFMFESLIAYIPEVQTKEILKSKMKGTFMDCDNSNNMIKDKNGNLKTYADILIEAASTYDISPVFLCTRIIQEKGSNNDKLGKGVAYNGVTYYNFFNIGATGQNDEEVQKTGLAEAVGNGWTSQYLAIMGGAQKIKENYIKSGRSTLYFQKFWCANPNAGPNENYALLQYMQNLLAPVNEGYGTMIAYKNGGKINKSFTFLIPVYENMPATPCQRPVNNTGKYDLKNSEQYNKAMFDTSNPNYKLKSLTVTGIHMDGSKENLPLFDTFHRDKTSYTINVPYKVSSVTISASAYAAKTSTITGTGTFNLKAGENVFNVVCKSEYGTSRTYKITISRSSTMITSLKPSIGVFDKNFASDVQSYNLYVSNATENVTLEYATELADAQVVLRRAGSSVQCDKKNIAIDSLKVGKNTIYLDVCPPAELESEVKEGTRTYEINIIRYTETAPTLSAYQVSNSGNLDTGFFRESHYINGFNIGDKISTVKTKLNVKNGKVKVFNSASVEKSDSELIATGDVIRIYDGNGYLMYKLDAIVYGDVSGDGKVDLFDFAYMKKKILKNSGLDGIYLKAADIYPQKEGLDLFDVAVLKKYILRNGKIEQTR